MDSISIHRVKEVKIGKKEFLYSKDERKSMINNFRTKTKDIIVIKENGDKVHITLYFKDI